MTPACGGFERRRKSRGRFRDVVIDERVKLRAAGIATMNVAIKKKICDWRC